MYSAEKGKCKKMEKKYIITEGSATRLERILYIIYGINAFCLFVFFLFFLDHRIEEKQRGQFMFPL